MICRLIRGRLTPGHPLRGCCRVLGMSPSGDDHARSRGPSRPAFRLPRFGESCAESFMNLDDAAMLGPSFERRPPAAREVLMAAARELQVSLPAGYLALMAQSDGGEGFTPSGEYVQLWAASELVHCNRSYALLPGDPRLVIIGSNGGGEAFALWYAASETEVVRVPFIGAVLNTIDRYASTFDEWIELLSQPEPSRGTGTRRSSAGCTSSCVCSRGGATA